MILSKNDHFLTSHRKTLAYEYREPILLLIVFLRTTLQFGYEI